MKTPPSLPKGVSDGGVFTLASYERGMIMLLKSGALVKIYYNPRDQVGYEGTAEVREDPRNDYNRETGMHFSRVRFMGETDLEWREFHDFSIITVK
jgi:hypothetical protein